MQNETYLQNTERHDVKRLNSTTPVPARARVIASTCVDLHARISAGLFREDLYRRLAAETLELPPLRERADDIRALARHFLERRPRAPRDLTPEADTVLRA